MKKKITISIGIPAYNEEQNIGLLLASILKQKQLSYRMQKIYVVCDGCKDKTAAVVRKIAKNNKNIMLLNDRKRKGKAVRLNTIYTLNKSDYILTFDADVVLERDIEIELMVKRAIQYKTANVIGGRLVPVKLDTFMGKLSRVSYLSFEDAVRKLKGGNNYYALVGCASLIKKSLAKSFTYPKGTISDQNYLYAIADKTRKNSVKIAWDTRILVRTVSTFMDWRLLGVRSTVSDKESVVSFFGEKVLRDYYMPRNLYFVSLIKWLLKSPIYTSGAILMNIYIRKFPYKKSQPKNGMWELTQSSKIGIL